MRNEQRTYENQVKLSKEAQAFVLEAHKKVSEAYALFSRAGMRRSLGHVIIDNMPFQNDRVKAIANTLDGVAERIETTETDLRWLMSTLNEIAIMIEQGV